MCQLPCGCEHGGRVLGEGEVLLRLRLQRVDDGNIHPHYVRIDVLIIDEYSGIVDRCVWVGAFRQCSIEVNPID